MTIDSKSSKLKAEIVDNVFEALGFDNPEEEMVRCELVSKIFHIGDDRGLNDKELARLAGCTQKRMAELRAIDFDDVTIDELCRYLVALGNDVRIVVAPKLEVGAHLSVVG
jgi:predicted XRE-type DNA-binding protein